MSDKENKINEEELAQAANEAEQVAEEVTEEAEVIGGEGDIEWNEETDAEVEESKVAQLEAALLQTEMRLKEQQDSVIRAKAEVENMRRRTEQEMSKARKFAINKFAEELLPVIDNLERAMEAADSENEVVKPFLEGIEMTHKSFTDVVSKNGLVEINPVGEAFNPELHNAVSMVESPDHESNTVTIVLQKGYELNGRVVRPAMVMVAK
ncbi:nucleotide exchange factor GrpE [Vibrio breoganii]|uniref:Protein GrpE n=1 Tax=Vibrio breoganii TaxID=553239 RepID=A0AAN0XVQ1_9VIBR|nr:nucleotide exchange factor GrpE [Vibrio breoganii]ANO33538.1 nucleotide exchange factor GrpE [Vibrio breoganii]OCH77446.1 nucleotide exchange factor GrpE [Vibrio breoganii]OED87908.1 nucleotide exchange factor GrpE [Vibrio breoganii ZF-55]OED98129.1 nucleotide exchange factor GrpE [Vibrio breoganii ZF-29]OEF85888.1 nucleotide exchange factor GrpE [Vibrio breoganii 1C10]